MKLDDVHDPAYSSQVRVIKYSIRKLRDHAVPVVRPTKGQSNALVSMKGWWEEGITVLYCNNWIFIWTINFSHLHQQNLLPLVSVTNSRVAEVFCIYTLLIGTLSSVDEMRFWDTFGFLNLREIRKFSVARRNQESRFWNLHGKHADEGLLALTRGKGSCPRAASYSTNLGVEIFGINQNLYEYEKMLHSSPQPQKKRIWVKLASFG